MGWGGRVKGTRGKEGKEGGKEGRKKGGLGWGPDGGRALEASTLRTAPLEEWIR